MRGTILGLAGFVLIAVPASGQEEKSWSAKTELGASVFFGNTSQSAVTTSLSGDLERGVLDLAGRAGSSYGEASNDEGVKFVNKRAWGVEIDVNYDPGTALNGLVRGKMESIFEKKIDRRYNVGAGGRYQFGSEEGTQSELSLAVLGEKTIPREGAGDEEGVVAKWSARFKLARGADGGRVRFESDTTFEPEMSDIAVYTLTSRNSIAFQLNQRIAVQLSFVDAYDTEAEARGARSNNDGQIFFSLASTF
jgi:hypothetical protein